MSFKWSILVATTSSRLSDFFVPLVLDLEKQIGAIGAQAEVQVIGLFDSKSMTIGDKRNALLDSADGEYMSFVDDDDMVHPGYVSTILDAIKQNPGVDLISFDIERQAIGTPNLLCRHSTSEVGDGHEAPDGSWVSPPNHIMVWKTSIARKVEFPLKNWREDYEWSREALKYVVEDFNIDRVLYWYRMQIELANEKGIPWKYHGLPTER